jgi:alpha-tubulin suppressor-like RCC1 family protein
MKSLKIAVLFACAVLVAACGDDPVAGGPRELTLSADTTYIAAQETVQLTASVDGAAGSGVAFRSLNEAVATVNGAGLVTGRSVGVTGIVAEAAGVADTIEIHVTPSPRGALATGDTHTCVLDVDGKAHCWGSNAQGQLGNGTTVGSTAPVAVVGGHTFAMVEAGLRTTCAVTPAGEGYCWGNGFSGQLGNGSTQSSAVPVRVSAPQPLASIAVGFDVVCALTRDGTAYCWGRNVSGNVGTGDRVMASTPTAVSTSLKFKQISVGLAQTCGLTADGTAYCWGRNFFRTLGTGDTSDRLTPAPVSGGLRFATLSAGSITTCAITIAGGAAGGEPYCWGTNFFGSLGVGRQGDVGSEGIVPIRVVGGQLFGQAAASEENSSTTPTCLLTAAGQAFCMGANQSGQLGTAATTETCQLAGVPGSFGCASRPLPVLGAPNFESIDPGAEFVCALSHAGEVYCWGGNESLQLGTFSGPSSFAPVRVAANLRLP